MTHGTTLTKEQAREAIISTLDDAVKLIPSVRPPDLPGFTNSEGVYIPGRHGFADHIWDLGEAIRKLVVQHPSLRRDPALFDGVAAIANNRAAQVGRRSFIMLLGSVRLARYAPQLVAQLDDTDVNGHVIYTLYLMRAGGYSEEVRPFLESPSAWIRREAKRYLAKYGG